MPKKLNVIGKKKENGRRPVEGLNYAKLLRYSISHMTNLRNQTLDMLLKVCLSGHLPEIQARVEVVKLKTPDFPAGLEVHLEDMF